MEDWGKEKKGDEGSIKQVGCSRTVRVGWLAGNSGMTDSRLDD